MYVSVSVALESAAWIICHDYGPAKLPILAVHDTNSFSIVTDTTRPALEQVAAARRFADVAATFAALTQTWADAQRVSLAKAA